MTLSLLRVNYYFVTYSGTKHEISNPINAFEEYSYSSEIIKFEYYTESI